MSQTERKKAAAGFISIIIVSLQCRLSLLIKIQSLSSLRARQEQKEMPPSRRPLKDGLETQTNLKSNRLKSAMMVTDKQSSLGASACSSFGSFLIHSLVKTSFYFLVLVFYCFK